MLLVNKQPTKPLIAHNQGCSHSRGVFFLPSAQNELPTFSPLPLLPFPRCKYRFYVFLLIFLNVFYIYALPVLLFSPVSLEIGPLKPN